VRKIPRAFRKCRISKKECRSPKFVIQHLIFLCGAWIVVGFGLAGPPQRLLPARREAGRVQLRVYPTLDTAIPPAKHAGFPGRKGRPRSSGSERKSPKQKAPGSATARLSLYQTPGHVWNARLVRHRGNTLKSSRSTTGDFCHTVCSQTTLLSNRHITLRFLSDYLSLAGGQGSVV
jgi:hypothetical protein